jgi:hypothetical protein
LVISTTKASGSPLPLPAGPAKLGLPAFRPDPHLYPMLLARGRPQVRDRIWEWPEDGLHWLGPELGRKVPALVGDGWLAQEWVDLCVLEGETAWLRGP